ncbi:MAG: glycosyltransferase family 2 protein, partial [Bacteroidetes bacterium]
MKKPSTVSIITINYRQAALTCDLLGTLRSISYSHYELLLVDNGQLTDESTLFRTHFPTVKMISSRKNL